MANIPVAAYVAAAHNKDEKCFTPVSFSYRPDTEKINKILADLTAMGHTVVVTESPDSPETQIFITIPYKLIIEK